MSIQKILFCIMLSCILRADNSGVLSSETKLSSLKDPAKKNKHDVFDAESSGSSAHETAFPLEINQVSPLTPVIKRKWRSWDLIFYDFVNGIYDYQDGCRGNTKFFSSNAFLFNAYHELCGGRFSFRTLFSLEPATIGRCGYPLLFFPGDFVTCRRELIDRFPPRDLVSQLAVAYVRPTHHKSLWFIYMGLPGIPAIGPLPKQRISAFYFPDGSLTHRWFDATRTVYGVITLGYRWKTIQLEFSGYSRRRPWVPHWQYQKPKLNSFSTRLSIFPTENIIAQLSYARQGLVRAVVPLLPLRRITTSVTLNKSWRNNFWQTTFAWGRDSLPQDARLSAYLLESSVNFNAHHILFGRFEYRAPDDILSLLLPIAQNEPDPEDNPTSEALIRASRAAGHATHLAKFAAGYTYQFTPRNYLRWAVGGSFEFNITPDILRKFYGKFPVGYFLFVRVELVEM